MRHPCCCISAWLTPCCWALARCRPGEEELRTPACCHWVSQTVIGHYFMADGPAQGLLRLAPKPHWSPFFLGGGVLLHSTDPQGSIISDTQPESTHCHKHKELIRESTEGAQRALLVPGEPQLFPINPHLRPARPPCDPPPLCCSAPASAQPCSSGKGFPASFLSCATYSGDSQAASRQCWWRAAREGQCPDGGVGLGLTRCRESLWGSNFLPSGPVSTEVWSFTPRQPTGPDHLPCQVSQYC